MVEGILGENVAGATELVNVTTDPWLKTASSFHRYVNQATRCLHLRCHQNTTARVQLVNTAVIELYTAILTPRLSAANKFMGKRA